MKTTHWNAPVVCSVYTVWSSYFVTASLIVLFIALHSFFSEEFIVTHTQQRAELTMQRHTHNWSVFVQPGFKWARISIFWKRSSAYEAPRSDGWERPLPVFRRDRPWGVNSSVMDILWLEMLLHSRCCCHPDSLDLHLPTLSPPFLSSKKKEKKLIAFCCANWNRKLILVLFVCVRVCVS